MKEPTIIPRPEPVIPAEELEALRMAYQDANVILEYGCGGSTVMASEMPNKTVYAVDSDYDWVTRLRKYFDQTPPAEGTKVDVSWVNIGPTKKWGHPKDYSKWQRYSVYPLNIWNQKEFQQPDVVLVDGRFRPGCALATAFRTAKPVTLLFDDYAPRKYYHRVEDYIGTPFMVGRMAIFEIEPRPIPADRLMQIIKLMTHP